MKYWERRGGGLGASVTVWWPDAHSQTQESHQFAPWDLATLYVRNLKIITLLLRIPWDTKYLIIEIKDPVILGVYSEILDIMQ